MNKAMTWGEMGVHIAALPPKQQDQPVLVQWQDNTEDWDAEVRPVEFLANGFGTGKQVLTREGYNGELRIQSREEYDENKQDPEDAKYPLELVRPLLLEQPTLMGWFELDEDILAALRAPDVEPWPVQAAVAPLFEVAPTPPGLQPRRHWLAEQKVGEFSEVPPSEASSRHAAVQQAILRYMAEGKELPQQWVYEFNEWARLRSPRGPYPGVGAGDLQSHDY